MSKLDDLRINAPMARPRRRSRIPWVPVAVVIFAVAVTLYLQRDVIFAGEQAASSVADSTGEAVSADSSPAATGPPGSISAAGYLEVIPPGPHVVSALVEGSVVRLLTTPGQEVGLGEVLAELDATQRHKQAAVLRARVEMAQGNLDLAEAGSRSEEIDQAAADLASARAVLDNTTANLDRSRELYERGVIAQQELESGELAVRTARARVDQAQARLDLLNAGNRTEQIAMARAELSAVQAELDHVLWEISQCTLKAPRAGVVLDVFVQPGDWLAPGTDNAKSAAVASVFDPRMVQAWVDVNQRDSSALFVGQAVTLATDAYPQREVKGRISRIMPRANLQKNTVQVKIAIDDPPSDFRPELSVKVTFLPDAGGMQPDDSQNEQEVV